MTVWYPCSSTQTVGNSHVEGPLHWGPVRTATTSTCSNSGYRVARKRLSELTADSNAALADFSSVLAPSVNSPMVLLANGFQGIDDAH